jgi:hypothetical protein
VRTSAVVSPARRSAQCFQVSDSDSSTVPSQYPRNIGPAGRNHRLRPHEEPRVVLSHRPSTPRHSPDTTATTPRLPLPADSGTASSSASGTAPTTTSPASPPGTHRPPRPPLHLLHALLGMRVTRIDVTPRIDDRNHHLAAVVGAVQPHLRGPGPMPDRPQILRAVPTMTTELLRGLASQEDHPFLESIVAVSGPVSCPTRARPERIAPS